MFFFPADRPQGLKSQASRERALFSSKPRARDLPSNPSHAFLFLFERRILLGHIGFIDAARGFFRFA
jgi:hypothetical protein